MKTSHHQFITAASIALLATAAQAQQGPGGDRGRGGFEQMIRMHPIMQALDQDEDGTLSKEEIDAAHTQLLTIDENGDGNLTSRELNPRRGRRGGFGGPPGMGPTLPFLDALDLDHDGELFEDEVTDAAASLRTLDVNGNGRIDVEELMPEMPEGMRGPGGFRGGPPGMGRGGRGGQRGGDGGGGGALVRPEELGPEEAMANVPDLEAFQALSYQGEEVMVDTHLAGLEFVKFQIEQSDTDEPLLYFMNTVTFRGHPMFMNRINSERSRERMRGVLIYWPMLKAPNGESGLFTFEFEPNDAYSIEKIQLAMDLLTEHSDLLKNRIRYKVLDYARQKYDREREDWDNSGIPLFFDEDRYGDVAVLPLHAASSYGRLIIMNHEDRPSPRDIVICASLPNEMPRVAGVISAVLQTPLSHVNLRAVQDDVPNAYVDGAMSNRQIQGLIGKYVYYEVNSDGYILREASKEEFESHFADLRPSTTQVPARDLSVRTIRPFSQVGFDDANTVGVKAANLATLRQFGFDASLTPNGFAVPFFFYDEFMKHNGFDKLAVQMIATSRFQEDAAYRAAVLEQFQKTIKKGKMPNWMMNALAQVQAQFPKGTSIRCRSSTNTEDLPSFSGAGLYDSFTHHPDEGHLSKSIMQVYASLWNFRAYEERDFYRIDHLATAMGVALHENSSDERANGVAVTRDILYQTYDREGILFYVNAQVGEDLVTNPDGNLIPEELLISPRNPANDRVIRRSSLLSDEQALLSDAHLLELRRAMRTIDKKFRQLYAVQDGEPFAMEVEFKIHSDGSLYIKQARPWVF